MLGGDHCNEFSWPVLVPAPSSMSQGKWLLGASGSGLSERSDQESLADEGLYLYLGIQG